MNPSSPPQSGFGALLHWLGDRTGLEFSGHRLPAAETSVRRAMTRAGTTDLEAYRAIVERDGAAFDDLVGELTVGETYFFREVSQFDFLRDTVVPDLRRTRPPNHVIRCWSAACASGEEAYSLAILFAELGLRDRVHLIGTDISRASLARALRATYRSWSFRGAGAERARPYLRALDGEYRLDEAVRRHAAFEYLNLALDTYPSFGNGIWGMDLILCRNVLIYFGRAAIRAVAQRLYASLAEGGWLVTASSDPPLGSEAPFDTVVSASGVYYRRTAAAAARPEAPRAWSRRSVGEPARTPFAGARGQRNAPDAFPKLPQRSPAAHERDAGLASARDAFARGDYAAAATLTAGLERDAEAAALHVRALANVSPERAVPAAEAAARRHGLSAELQYLLAAILSEVDRVRDALEAIRRVIYLDPSLAIAHFSMGTMLQRLGDLEAARRAFRNARDLCATLEPETVLSMSDGERAGRLAEIAEAHLAVLDSARGAATRDATRANQAS